VNISDKLNAAAEILADHRLAGRRFDRFPENLRPADQDEAYSLQARLHERLTAKGCGPLAGRKIGCTTPVMQAYLKIDSPCAGGVFAPTARERYGIFQFEDFRRVGVECEIAVRLGADLTPAGGPYTIETVSPAVAACMAAIEVVDDRYVDYPSLDTPTLIGDDFFDAGCVLGQPVTDWRSLDLATLPGRMTINGTEVGNGVGGDIMGHPLAALAWLASHTAARGETLPAGSFVLLGSVVQTKWLAKGDEVVAQIDGLGEAVARFD